VPRSTQPPPQRAERALSLRIKRPEREAHKSLSSLLRFKCLGYTFLKPHVFMACWLFKHVIKRDTQRLLLTSNWRERQTTNTTTAPQRTRTTHFLCHRSHRSCPYPFSTSPVSRNSMQNNLVSAAPHVSPRAGLLSTFHYRFRVPKIQNGLSACVHAVWHVFPPASCSGPFAKLLGQRKATRARPCYRADALTALSAVRCPLSATAL
jgi:hypothetical protein